MADKINLSVDLETVVVDELRNKQVRSSGQPTETLTPLELEQLAWRLDPPPPVLARRLDRRAPASGAGHAAALFAPWASELAALGIGKLARASPSPPRTRPSATAAVEAPATVVEHLRDPASQAGLAVAGFASLLALTE